MLKLFRKLFSREPQLTLNHAYFGRLLFIRGANVASNYWEGELAVAACEQDILGLQTRADAGQRFVRIPGPVGQCSSQMSQRSCANGLQTHPWANTHCE
jgi:hypothetical protein